MVDPYSNASSPYDLSCLWEHETLSHLNCTVSPLFSVQEIVKDEAEEALSDVARRRIGETIADTTKMD